ncbi:MAG: hypothetical protein MUC87_22120 [Bacteroidia bacterium]|jgi:hypothetical protein|nr:hypothetical protein [Bacteroidia bacterium]
MNRIFSLIKMLEPGEKRYFSLVSSHYDRASLPDYFALYRALSEFEETDERVFIQKNRKQKFIRNLALNKHSLWQRLLSALVHYHDEDVLVLKLRKQLSQAELLIDRDFFEEAENLLGKVAEICRMACLSELELETTRLQIRISSLVSESKLLSLLDRRNEIIRIITENDEYNRLLTELVNLFQFNTGNNEALAGSMKLIKHPLLAPGFKPLSIMGEVFRHAIMDQYNYYMPGVKPTLEHNRAITHLLSSNDWMIRLHTSLFTTNSMNLVILGFQLREATVLHEVLDKINKSKLRLSNFSGVQPLLFESMTLICEVYIFYLEDRTDKIMQMEKKITAMCQKLDLVRETRAHYLRMIYFKACLEQRDYRKGIRIMQYYLQNVKKPKSVVVHRICNYALMICLLSKGSYSPLKRLLRQIEKLTMSVAVSETEKALIQFFKHVVRDEGMNLRENLRILNHEIIHNYKTKDESFVKWGIDIFAQCRAMQKASDFRRELEVLNTELGLN